MRLSLILSHYGKQISKLAEIYGQKKEEMFAL